jgi:probable HAF family extracellular repeat protein
MLIQKEDIMTNSIRCFVARRIVLLSLTTWTALTVFPILISQAAHAGITYTVTDLGFLPGDDSSQGGALNDLGEAVGVSSYSQTLSIRAFLYQDGKLINLSALVAPNDTVIPYSINLQGQVVGQFYNDYTMPQGFLYDHGRVQVFNVSDGAGTWPLSINNLGRIVGTYTTSSQHYEAFLREPSGKIIKLGAFGGVDVQGVVINFWSQIAGTFLDASGSHAFLTQPGGRAPKDLGSLGGGSSVVRGVNDIGQVIGVSLVTPSDWHGSAFLYTGGTMRNLGTLGSGSETNGINNWGQIIGISQNGIWVYSQGQMLELNSLLSPEAKDWHIGGLSAINDRGQILACGVYRVPYSDGMPHAVTLTPTFSRN